MTPVQYPFPLSDGTLAYVTVPPSFTPEDAERMCAMVRSLVFQEEEPKE